MLNNYPRLKRILIPIILFLITGISCINSPHPVKLPPNEVMIGTWEVDIIETKNAIENANVMAEGNIEFETGLEILTGAKIIFDSEKLTIMKDTSDEKISDSNKYKITSILEDSVTIESIEKENKGIQATIIVVDNDTIKWYEKDDIDMPVIVLKRVK